MSWPLKRPYVDGNFAFNECLELCRQAAKEEMEEFKKGLPGVEEIEEIIHKRTYWHQGKSPYLDYKRDCHYCNDRPWLKSIAVALRESMVGNEKKIHPF